MPGWHFSGFLAKTISTIVPVIMCLDIMLFLKAILAIILG